MDPVTALGVAAATVQFISFAGDVISKSRELYLSADGTLVTQTELDTIAKSLVRLCAPIKHWDPARGKRWRLNSTELELKGICQGCVREAESLQRGIEKLKIQGSHHRKWKSFRQALNSINSEREIEQLSTRLDRYRAQLDTTLLFILRQKIDAIEEKQELSSAQISKEIIGTADENKRWQAELIRSIHEQDWNPNDRNAVGEFSALVSTFSDTQRKNFIEADILRRLRFQTMDDRHERIPEAYLNTFEWIFYEPRLSQGEVSFDSYLHWLQSPEAIYWITGKPGAGKSTLMKYIFNHSRTREIVAPRSDQQPLILAGFFFWNSGTELQMSRNGLLQTLLYQIVERDRSYIPLAFKDCWQNYELFGGDIHNQWQWSDLVKFFKILISGEERKFMFFIDGLDEFAGDHTELINFILEISQLKNVKICVASRPWLAFEEAFGRRPRLKVETLTKSDITRFVSEKLQTSQRFIDLEVDEPSDAKRLIDEVTGKAHGVFLWVYLVVRSLQEGLRDGDTMKDLLFRISLLPPDLEELFRKILDRLDTLYFRQASILFQLMNAAQPRPLTLLSFEFAEESFESAMKAEIKPLSERQLVSKAESVRRRLNSRSKGLLEATPVKDHPENAQVQYLHRTVKDFLSRSDIWAYIVSGTDTTFNANVTLCGIYLLELKTARVSKATLRPLWNAVRGCIDHACQAEEALAQGQIRLLDEVDRAAGQVWNDAKETSSSTKFRKTNYWTDTLVEYLEAVEDCHTWVDCFPSTSFFDFAVCCNLHRYVETKISSGIVSRNHFLNGRTLLCLATQRKDMRLITYLLEHKADPNKSSKSGLSAWQQLLSIIDSTYFSEPESCYELATLYLDYGADPKVLVNGEPAFRILETAFGGWDFDRMKQLLRSLLKTHKSLNSRKDWPKALFKRESEAIYIHSDGTYEQGLALDCPLPDWAFAK